MTHVAQKLTEYPTLAWRERIRSLQAPKDSLVHWLVQRGWLIALLPAVLYMVRAIYYNVWIDDDPFISYRYAQHLAHGEGLVFNLGERVEGYSNFLWVLVLAAAVKMGLAPETLSPWLGIASFLALIVFLATRTRQGAFRGTLAALSLALVAPIAYWAPKGLEVPFYTLALFFGFWWGGSLLSHPSRHSTRWWYAAWAAMSIVAITRPEGPMFCLVLAGAAAFAWRRLPAAHQRAAVAGAAGSFLFQLGYHTWRVWYFGSLLPNSFTAKATGSVSDRLVAGVDYALRGFFLDFPVLTVLCLLGLAFCIRERRRGRHAEPADLASKRVGTICPHYGLFASVVGAQVFFVVYVGGDWMFFSRFLVPALPFMAVLGQDAFQMAWQRVAKRDPNHVGRDALALACVGLLVIGLVSERWRSSRLMQVVGDGTLIDRVLELGEWMGAALPGDATLAAEEAGYIPYITGMHFLDMLGIVTPAVARVPGGLHEKTNAPWILAQKPEFILLIAVPHQEDFFHPVDKALPASQAMLHDPEFHENYRLIYAMARGSHVFGRANMLLYGRRELTDATYRGPEVRYSGIETPGKPVPGVLPIRGRD